MDLSYRIVSGQTYRVVSPPNTVIVSYRIVHYRREIHLHQRACGDLSCYRKLSPPSPNRIVSYRIVSPWRGYRLLAYRELSQIALIGKYRIVTYRALIVSYRIGRSRAMGPSQYLFINTNTFFINTCCFWYWIFHILC